MSTAEIDLTSPEIKAAIQAAVEEATQPLAAKNRELLGELKEARKGRTINPEDISKLEDEIEAWKGKVGELEKSAKTLTKERDAAVKSLAEESSYTTNLVRENALNEALAASGVTNPAYLKAAKAMLSGDVQVVVEDGKRVAKFGDKSPGDYVKEWSELKHFAQAPVNSGGGAPGGSGGAGNPKTMTRSQFDSSSQAERANFARSGGQVVEG